MVFMIHECHYILQTWETRYVLLLWLYVISMIPFDLSKMDGSFEFRIIDRLMEISKIYLGVTDKSRDAAVLLCARWVYMYAHVYTCTCNED